MSDGLTEQIIGIAIAVHRELGPGLLESTYEACMAYEMMERSLPFVRQKPLSVVYKNKKINAGYRIDFLVADSIIVEIKSIEKLDAIHAAQILTYLKLSGCRIGLLINFNVPLLKDGIRRYVNGLEKKTQRPQRPLW
jgi:GxxExxY protein